MNDGDGRKDIDDYYLMVCQSPVEHQQIRGQAIAQHKKRVIMFIKNISINVEFLMSYRGIIYCLCVSPSTGHRQRETPHDMKRYVS